MSSTLPATMKNLKNVSVTLTRGLLSSTHNVANSPTLVQQEAKNREQFHISAKQDYPQAELLPLPYNIDQSEATRFSPQRSRDISSDIIDYHNTAVDVTAQIDITVDNSIANEDAHVGPYDCTGIVNLNSSMQSNVPSPFGGMHKFTHLNMPGGQWGQGVRFVANDLHLSHYTNLRRSVRMNWSTYDETVKVVDEAAASPNQKVD